MMMHDDALIECFRIYFTHCVLERGLWGEVRRTNILIKLQLFKKIFVHAPLSEYLLYLQCPFIIILVPPLVPVNISNKKIKVESE